MPLPTKRTEAITNPNRLLVLIYGATTTGKSTFCSRPDDVCILGFDSTLKHISGFKYEPIITSWEQLIEAQRELAAGKHGFKNVSIDNLSRAFELCKEYIRIKKGVDHETDIPGQSKGYALVNDEFKRMIFGFISLPYGIYFGCHERDEKVKTRSQEYTKIVPDLPSSARGDLVNLCDFVLYAYKEEIEIPGSAEKRTVRWMLTKGDVFSYEGKDRFDWLPSKMQVSYPLFLEECKKGAARKAGQNADVAKPAQAGQEVKPPANDASQANPATSSVPTTLATPASPQTQAPKTSATKESK